MPTNRTRPARPVRGGYELAVPGERNANTNTQGNARTPRSWERSPCGPRLAPSRGSERRSHVGACVGWRTSSRTTQRGKERNGCDFVAFVAGLQLDTCNARQSAGPGRGQCPSSQDTGRGHGRGHGHGHRRARGCRALAERVAASNATVNHAASGAPPSCPPTGLRLCWGTCPHYK